MGSSEAHQRADILGRLPRTLRNVTAVYHAPPLEWKLASAEVLCYLNFPVTATAGTAVDPWRLVATEATEADYVVLKLDIDTPRVEQRLVSRLRHDIALLHLVDEFYYEHHVRESQMMAHGWGLDQEELPTENLAENYELFGTHRANSAARRAGGGGTPLGTII